MRRSRPRVRAGGGSGTTPSDTGTTGNTEPPSVLEAFNGGDWYGTATREAFLQLAGKVEELAGQGA